MTTTPLLNDHDLLTAVLAELHWVPEIDAGQIDIDATDGVVTLSGHVPSYAQKIAAGKAAFRTRSVADVMNDLRVHRPDDDLTDAELVASARAALDCASSVPGSLVTVAAHDGVVTLAGEVTWNFERVAATKTVGGLTGVHGVDNRITLTHRRDADARETKELIRDAIKRQAILDATHIEVHTSGDSVELSGTVSSWAEKHQAEVAAWSSPHVNHVHNQITVRALGPYESARPSPTPES